MQLKNISSLQELQAAKARLQKETEFIEREFRLSAREVTAGFKDLLLNKVVIPSGIAALTAYSVKKIAEYNQAEEHSGKKDKVYIKKKVVHKKEDPKKLMSFLGLLLPIALKAIK